MKNIKKIIIVLGIVTLFLFSIITPVIGTDNHKFENQIILEYSFSEPVIDEIEIKEEVYNRIIIDGLANTNDYNQPRLPIKPLKILLPPGKTVRNIDIISSDKENIEGSYNIETGGKLIPIASSVAKKQEQIINNKNLNLKITSPLYKQIGIHTFRGFSILYLNLYPVQYETYSGEVTYHKNIKLKIELKDQKIDQSFRGLDKDFEIVEKIIDNPDYLEKYDQISFKESSNEKYEYVIITEEQFKSASRGYDFHDIVDLKRSQGLNAIIVTVEEIMNNPDYSVEGKWGDANPYNPFHESEIIGSYDLFDDTPARIRNFIRYAYKEWNTDYVLLGGDADVYGTTDNIIPLRGLFANESGLPLEKLSPDEEEDDIPSDVYYACLDGNFNYDCDDHFGESPDRNDIIEVDEADLLAEVWVGRACIDSDSEIYNFTKKTLEYQQNEYGDYVSNILFVGEYLGSLFFSPWGGDYKDELEKYIPSTYNLYKLYDRDYPGNNWLPDDLFNELYDVEPQIINHDGHGNCRYMFKMSGNNFFYLQNEKPFFIYSHSCLTGSFDNWDPWDGYDEEDCIAEILTCETPYGAYACVLNARYGLGSEDSIESPSGSYDESFFKALFQEDIREIGHANHYSKEDNIWRIDENGYRWCYYQTNLFGDPHLSIKDTDDKAPFPPSMPTGSTNGKPGVKYNYSTSTTDPLERQVYYWFDWGDDTDSGWLGPFDSGEAIIASHTWNDRGRYEVLVKAKNSDGIQSGWSDPLTINMQKSKMRRNHLLQEFLHNFPIISRLLNLVFYL